MKPTRLLALLVIAWLVSSTGRAATELWPVTDAQLNPIAFAQTTIKPLSAPNTNGLGGFATKDVLYVTTDANGLATATNLVPGGYTWSVQGPFTVTPVSFTITNFVSTNYVAQNSTSGTNLPGVLTAYSMAASDARYVMLPALTGVTNMGWYPTSTNFGAAYAWMPAPGSGGGSGTVTSVGFTPDGVIFSSVTGSPVTTSGSLAPALATHSANTFFAGPASGSAAAGTFRQLVNADFPSGLAPTFSGANLTSIPYSALTGTPNTNLYVETNDARSLNLSQIANTISGTFTGKQYLGTQTVNGSTNINWTAGTHFTFSISGNTPFAFANNADTLTLVVAVIDTGSFLVTWPSGVKWAGGSAPTQTASHTDVYTFVQLNGTIYGSAVQNF